MKRTRRVTSVMPRLGSLLVAMSLAPAVSAGVYDTGDTGTAGGIEIEMMFATTRSHDELGWHSPDLAVNGRVNDRVEWSIGGGYGVVHHGEDVAHRGLGDLSLGTKWRLRDEGPGSSFSLAIEPEFSFPTGDEAKGLGAGAMAFALPLRVARHFGPVRVTGEVSVERVFGRDEDVLGAGLLAEYAVSEQWSYGVELVADAPRADTGAYHLHGNVGFKWEPGEHVELQALAGRSIDNRQGDPAATYRVFLAYKL